MVSFKYRMKRHSPGFSSGECDGTCRAKNVEEAADCVRKGMAIDLNISEGDILELNLTALG